jgi:hypothetical protein
MYVYSPFTFNQRFKNQKEIENYKKTGKGLTPLKKALLI